MEVVLYRACTLYEAAFGPNDRGFIVSGRLQFATTGHRGFQARLGKHRTFRSTVFQLSKQHSLGLRGIAGRQRVVVDRDENTVEIATLRWARMQSREIGYKFILQALANNDFYPRRPRTDDRVYFVNQTRNVILHMYDDRGLDILAANRSDLQAIYDTYKPWLLDYDRVRMEKVFEQVAD